MLKERLEKVGHFLFKYRGYQHIPLLFVLLMEREHFNGIGDNIRYEIACIFVAFLGLAVRGLTVGFVHDGTSGRNTKEQKASELNTTGAYSIVRNPLYLGNYLILFGISLLTENHEVLLFNTIIFACTYIPIILTEEAFLHGKFGEDYHVYKGRVNRFFPTFRSWRNFQKPLRQFSFRMLLKREHDTLLTTTLSLLFIELLREYGTFGAVRLEGIWIVIAAAASLTWIPLKYMKKTGRLTIG